MTEKHGGKRKGAGRKPSAETQEKKALTIRCDPDIAEKFRRNCEERGITQEDGFTFFVRALPG